MHAGNVISFTGQGPCLAKEGPLTGYQQDTSILCQIKETPVYYVMWSAMWCLLVAGRMVVHQYLGGGSHLQPLLGWCLILLPPRHPCVMEVEQVLGFSGGVCFPLVCTPLHLASACVWQIHHRLCGFVIVIRSLVFVA